MCYMMLSCGLMVDGSVPRCGSCRVAFGDNQGVVYVDYIARQFCLREMQTVVFP
jgi:hypothetical protein